MHGITGGLISQASGGNFGSGFFSGMVSSAVASGVNAIGIDFSQMNPDGSNVLNSFGEDYMQAAMIAAGGLSGGISSTIAGGNFWDGLRQGIITSALNHVAHLAVGDGDGDTKPKPESEKKSNETQGSGSIGQPSTLENMIPVWGSSRAAIDDFQNGNYFWGAFHTGMAISDVFLVKSIATGVGKGAWKLGSHSWGATRKWLGKNGYAELGQHVHHWAVHQATAKKFGLEAVTNQPWNLMPMRSPALHQSIHGVGPNAFGPIGQFWHGTPTWFKAGMFSGGGRTIN